MALICEGLAFKPSQDVMGAGAARTSPADMMLRRFSQM
jgi:hypothetical protein